MTTQTADKAIPQQVLDALRFYAATESYASANSIAEVMRDRGQLAKDALRVLGTPPSEFDQWLAKHNVLTPTEGR